MSLVDNIKSYSETLELSSDKKKLLDSFLSKGFPTTKDEEWKYTSLKKIISKDFSIEKNGTEISEIKLNKYSLGFENKIVFVDGKLISFASINNVSVSSFSDFENNKSDSISNLNSSLATSGFTIIVDKNSIIENPIEILFFNTIENNFTQYRNTISVGKNTQATTHKRI